MVAVGWKNWSFLLRLYLATGAGLLLMLGQCLDENRMTQAISVNAQCFSSDPAAEYDEPGETAAAAAVFFFFFFSSFFGCGR